MKYVQYVNQLIKDEVSSAEGLVVYGQNVSLASCLGGLTRNLAVPTSSRIINTPNSENTLVGAGFGMMLNGVSAIYFMKQQDFLLLSIDHLVNTYNIIRTDSPKASFSIVPIVVDSGYEGPQSCLNSFSDFCSIARIDGYSCTNRDDTKRIIRQHLISPGFRIIGVSQRLLGASMLEVDTMAADKRGRFFQYQAGKDATVVCFNYSLPYGLKLCDKMSKSGMRASLFSVNTYSAFDFAPILEDISRTRNVVVMDDSKSGNQLCDRFLYEAVTQCRVKKSLAVRRTLSKKWFYPNADHLSVKYSAILSELRA
jgi:acetoin:2,6-dichlorophenolindophenol oxidoreductase subunit beta